ncbi:porin family protein [Allosphingosinicella flava]|uniref:Porin family protein n=1 Tax=Allosphingosinicella flava TaxID=2771430 RepID=A0A7T2GIP8_9SPHN|nr:porin family protein [Sphingosinicella flava]QPQ54614.1 porin family protein [Sphingosinicella flava]
MRTIVLAALLAGTAATPAFAQNGAAFTGPRVEGIVGYDSLKSGNDDGDGVDTSDDEGDESIDGVAYGIGVGYDFDLGGVVAGVEAEYMDSSANQEADETTPDGLGFTSRVEAGRDIYVGGRIGFPVTPSTLLYVKGGYTNTSIEAGYETDSDSFEFDTNVDGYRLGAGVEQKFGTNLYGKLEYRYSNYTNIDFDDDFDLDDFESEDVGGPIDLDRHQVVASIGMRF